MNHNQFYLVILCVTFAVSSCKNKQEEKLSDLKFKESMLLNKTDITAPIAEKKPENLITHGDTRIDNYFWMRLSDEQKNASKPDDQTQKVLDYLNAENAYREKMMSHTDSFQNRLFEEIKGRIKQTDMSVPYKITVIFILPDTKKGKNTQFTAVKKTILIHLRKSCSMSMN